jgi:nucleoside-diphosphate-sugar epimerase
MRVFLTGATGFIGSFLAEELLKRGYQVRCLVRKTSNLRWIKDLNVEYHYGSLLDAESLSKGLAGCQFVYHLAGLTKARTEEEYFKGNFEGTRHLVDAALLFKDHINRFIYVGSQAAAGPSPTIKPIDESYVPQPLTYYGKSKLAGEEYVQKQAAALAITIIRPPVVYGQRDTDVLEFFRTVSKGLIPQLGKQEKYVSLIHVRDLNRGIIMAAENPQATGQIYFISNRYPYSWQEVSQATLRVLNKKGHHIIVPIFVMKIVAAVSEVLAAVLTKKPALVNRQKVIEMEQNYWICSAEKARKEIGFENEISLEQGIRETLKWYKEYKWM